MTNNRVGLLSQMWKNLKKSLIIFRTTDKYIGTDEFGNKYFERLQDDVNELKRQRKVVPLNPDQWEVPKLPVEWMTWLQGRRIDPPTEEELSKNKANMLKTQHLVSELQKKVSEEKLKEDTSNDLVHENKKQAFPKYPGYEIKPGEHDRK